MFTIQDLTVILQAIQSMDIKGSDAIYISQLMSKIDKMGTELNEKEDKKQQQAKEIIEKSSKTKNK